MSIKKRMLAIGMVVCLTLGMVTGCGNQKTNTPTEEKNANHNEETTSETLTIDSTKEINNSEVATQESQDTFEQTEIQVFIAASLSAVMEELATMYQDKQPNVTITFNADSSGVLLTQIQDGFSCDVFFSAAQKQMNTLEEDGMLVDGTRQNVVNNQVCVITYPGSGTKVTGLNNLKDATSIALADGSVPVGKYTRQALINGDLLKVADGVEASAVTTTEVSEALGGVEINECGNVSKVRTAVVEQANEVGTVYYSDTYGYENQVEILEKVSYDLTGNVIYPIAQVQNKEADELENKAAADFISFVTSDEAKTVFERYLFDTDVE